jgi:hypothetical protein
MVVQSVQTNQKTHDLNACDQGKGWVWKGLRSLLQYLFPSSVSWCRNSKLPHLVSPSPHQHHTLLYLVNPFYRVGLLSQMSYP